MGTLFSSQSPKNVLFENLKKLDVFFLTILNANQNLVFNANQNLVFNVNDCRVGRIEITLPRKVSTPPRSFGRLIQDRLHQNGVFISNPFADETVEHTQPAGEGFFLEFTKDIRATLRRRLAFCVAGAHRTSSRPGGEAKGI